MRVMLYAQSCPRSRVDLTFLIAIDAIDAINCKAVLFYILYEWFTIINIGAFVFYRELNVPIFILTKDMNFFAFYYSFYSIISQWSMIILYQNFFEPISMFKWYAILEFVINCWDIRCSSAFIFSAILGLYFWLKM